MTLIKKCKLIRESPKNGDTMQLDLAGLLRERLPSGNFRFRVRVEGHKHKRVSLTIPPEHPDFLAHYRAARAGIALTADSPTEQAVTEFTVDWLTHLFEASMRQRVDAGLMHKGTLHQRSAFYARLRADYGQKHMAMPRHAVENIRDSMTATPGAADNMVKSIRALYAWAIRHGHVTENPASGIEKINRGTGATAWTLQDMQEFKARHPVGSQAHLALTLFMFTACRIDDVVRLGPANEVTRDGLASLSWQPGKRGSAPVTVPILPPLSLAISATETGSAYLLTDQGKPFASSAAFGNKFRTWVAQAGLTDRSPHGIRKAAGELMALSGASQYHIMAVHGHTQAKTSEIYTKGVNRTRLAAEAMETLRGMEW